jgi:hypothetical protein
MVVLPLTTLGLVAAKRLPFKVSVKPSPAVKALPDAAETDFLKEEYRSKGGLSLVRRWRDDQTVFSDASRALTVNFRCEFWKGSVQGSVYGSPNGAYREVWRPLDFHERGEQITERFLFSWPGR